MFLAVSSAVLLPKKRNYFIETGYSQYVHSHHEEDLLETRYASTLHVDSETVLKTIAHSKEYEILPLNLSSVTWSQAVMDTVSRL